MVLLDSSTFNITSINNIGAQNDGWAPLETYNFPNAGYSSPTTGSIYIGGSVQQTHNATCRWNFTMDGWWSSTSASDFNVFPFIAKFTKDLEWPEVRM